jgi:hypothetical protein
MFFRFLTAGVPNERMQPTSASELSPVESESPMALQRNVG